MVGNPVQPLLLLPVAHYLLVNLLLKLLVLPSKLVLHPQRFFQHFSCPIILSSIRSSFYFLIASIISIIVCIAFGATPLLSSSVVERHVVLIVIFRMLWYKMILPAHGGHQNVLVKRKDPYLEHLV
ncbi:hypothetical protein VNO80_03334 [Phaseolus coccineus]|uniref:Uncharacterized protein n=1 Tax=Phaseolus coccineus TaxID=3886 RepID=A0AAN9RME2_PHACN